MTRKLNWMKGKQGKQKRREQLCCLFIGCIFKFFNLLYGAYSEFTHFLLTQPSVVAHENKGSRGVASLQNVWDDSEINKDAVFLGKFQEMLEKNETSVLFKPHLNNWRPHFSKLEEIWRKESMQRYSRNKGRVNKSSREQILWTRMITTYSNCFRTCKRYQKDITKRMYL